MEGHASATTKVPILINNCPALHPFFSTQRPHPSTPQDLINFLLIAWTSIGITQESRNEISNRSAEYTST